MGPISLFDKSFLQSLSVDESVWFDNFFYSVTCPLFFVETLADLSKIHRDGRDPLHEVSAIAAKTPEMHGAPCVHHVTLCKAALMGYPVPMTGQIPLARGRPVRHRGRTGVVFDGTPEAEAFHRWQRGRFHEIEHDFARHWRASLQATDLQRMADDFRRIGINPKTCKTLDDAKVLAMRIVTSTHKPYIQIDLACTLINADRHLKQEVLQRWRAKGCAPLSVYAPYAAHVVAVEIFFQCALAGGQIAAGRPSNKVDIEYLFYLPFCMIFVSGDRLHSRCAPHFLRQDQSFVWGPDLKADLVRLNQHYSQTSSADQEKGLMRFASAPPDDDSLLVRRLWDKHLVRHISHGDRTEPKQNPALVKELNEFVKAPRMNPRDADFNLADPDSIAIQRMVRKKKGSWWQLPSDLEAEGGA